MNFFADTVKFFVDLETGHRAIFNPFILCHKIFINNMLGLELAFLFYSF